MCLRVRTMHSLKQFLNNVLQYNIFKVLIKNGGLSSNRSNSRLPTSDENPLGVCWSRKIGQTPKPGVLALLYRYIFFCTNIFKTLILSGGLSGTRSNNRLPTLDENPLGVCWSRKIGKTHRPGYWILYIDMDKYNYRHGL